MSRLHKAISFSALGVAARGVLGFTVNPFTGYQPRSGYAVGVGLEQRYEHQPTTAQIRHYVRQHQHVLGKFGHYLGGWQTEDAYCLDVSRVFPSGDLGLRAAVTFGRDLGEQSYADLSTGVCVDL